MGGVNPSFISYLLSLIYYLFSLEGFAVFVVGILVEDAEVADKSGLGYIALLDSGEYGAARFMGVGAVVKTAVV